MNFPRQVSSHRLLAGAVGVAIAIHLALMGGAEVHRRWFGWGSPARPQEMEVTYIDDLSKIERLELPELAEIPEVETKDEPRPEEARPEEKRESEEKKKEKQEKKKLEKDRKKLEPPRPVLAKREPPPKPEPPRPKKVEPPKPVVAKKPEPPKPPKPPEPPKKKEEEKKEQKKAQLPKIDRKKMVEVDDEKNVVKDTNYEATYWSDKNRRVKVESRDTQTNLEKQHKGKNVASAPSPDRTSEEIGGKEDKIRQNEDAEQTSLTASKRTPPTQHNGDAQKAKGVLVGEQGKNGAGGNNGGGGDGGKPGALSMRNVEGKGAPGMGPRPNATIGGADDAPVVSMNKEPGAPAGDGTSGGAPGKPGKPGKRGPRLNLEQKDYARIVGTDKVKEEERQVAMRQKSHRRGRWEKKLEGIRSSLENFTPEVKPGNQTALGTRAHPFALYIAKMHRSIHELWGFGFLEDLDRKSTSNPMNDRTLAVTMEIVVASDGSVEKVTIVKPSGVLTFDVAAIDTVMSAGPYDAPEEAIRSGDGKVYMHWTFHRDERQCTPYFADPFILDNEKQEATGSVVKRGLPDPTEEVARRKRESPERLTRGKEGGETDGDVQVPTMTQEQREQIARAAEENPDVQRASNNAPKPDDPAAESAALAWANAFEKGDVGGLVAASTTPFKSGGSTVASDDAGLAKIWKNVVGESARRDIKEWKLFSAAGYRAVFGRLPSGGEDGSPRLYLVVKFGGEQLTLDVIRDANGVYRVSGLSR